MKKNLLVLTIFLTLTTCSVLTAQVTANFGWTVDTMYCGTMGIAFHDSSTGNVISWYWNFGNGGTSIIQNPHVFYHTGDVYSVTLIVTDIGGNRDTLLRDSIINVPFPNGTFTFTPTSGSNPVTVCFSANTLNTANYTWDFGDGTVLSSVGDTCHTYTNAGTFNPVLLLQNTLPTGAPCVVVAANLTGQITVNPAGVNEYMNDILFTISPNPFSTQTTLRTDNLFRSATLTACNSFGQTVKQIKNISGQTVVFYRDNLPSGLYFIRITQYNKTVATGKLVIADK